MSKVLLIGGSGYVGSALYEHLKTKHTISNWDLNWFDSFVPSTRKDYNTITPDELTKYDVVVLLAGHSSVNMCKTDLYSAYANNVVNFVNLTRKLSHQKFIYASSASVYGATPLADLKESDTNFKPINPYDLTKLHIDQIVEHTQLEYYGLRFGTVNGVAPHWRTDVMINAMTNTALEQGCVKLFNGDVKRSILGVTDACRAIESIIEGNDNRGIYNLASFTATSRQIAQRVASITGVQVEEAKPTPNTNEKLANTTYDFGMNTDKFTSTYGFEFKDTIETLTKGLINDYTHTQRSHRNVAIHYPR